MQYKWIALSVTTVGTLMAGIDTRIIIVGLPTVARELGADVESIIWVSQSYLLASTVGLLLIGRITDVIGRVKIYNIGFAVFTVGSALASISQSPTQLILSRIVQGTGSAMLLTNSAAILTDATPSNELGTILGINQIAFRVGSVAGLTLSGVIIAMSGWRALFYLNIPIGIFGTIWAHRQLREISTRDVQGKMDWLGFATFTSGLTLVLLSITFLSYGMTEVLPGFVMLAVGSILLFYFIRVEIRTSTPLLDLRLFRIKAFAAGNLAQLLNALAWFGIVLMLSFYMQVVLDFSALQTGAGLLPLEVAFVLFGPMSGKLSDKYGTRLFSTLGLSISSVGFFWLTQVNLATTYSEVAIPLALLGVGNGTVCFSQHQFDHALRASEPEGGGVRISHNHVQRRWNGQRRISDSPDYNRHSLHCLFESAAELEPRYTWSVAGTGIYKWIQGRGRCVCRHQHLCDYSFVPART